MVGEGANPELILNSDYQGILVGLGSLEVMGEQRVA